MGKYDSLKYWAKVKARVPHRCQQCNALIEKGEFYYKERIDLVSPPPGFVFGELCHRCGDDKGLTVNRG